METYIVYLMYLAVLLILGIVITAICHKMGLSNILFLVLAGSLLGAMGFDFFNPEIILILSSLALILIVLETTMELDLAHVMRHFFEVFKFNIVYLLVCSYIITLGAYLLFDIPGKGFEVFVLCFLLSIIIYGVDPIIAMEFFEMKKRRVKEMLEIEGIISGPMVVVFAFFVIGYIQAAGAFTSGFADTGVLLLNHVFIALALGLIVAFVLHRLLGLFPITKELSALLVISVGIVIFVVGEFLQANGSLAVAIYGIFLRGLSREPLHKRYTSQIAHILYIIVFILFGIAFFFPAWDVWVKGILLFSGYLILRFLIVTVMLKQLHMKEKVFMTLNVAKGIEVAIVLFIMKLNFSHVEGIQLILSIGFMFFILSYILATAVNYYNDWFLRRA